MKDWKRSFIISFAILVVFFLFGALKDFANLSYRYFLPIVFVLLVSLFIGLNRSTKSLNVFSNYLKYLLLILVTFEVAHLVVNVFSKTAQPDFGDAQHRLLSQTQAGNVQRKPHIFWIVPDEYSASQTLKTGWNYINSLDSMLGNEGFFVADSATGPFNFTHYSMGSTLDMNYFKIDDNQVVRYEDMVLGDRSVYNNNVVRFLQQQGYGIKNYTMFDMQGLPAHPLIKFNSEPAKLISGGDMITRIQRDITWNFTDDSLANRRQFAELAQQQHELINLYKDEVKRNDTASQPQLFMFQYMITHEPFLFNEDGTLHAHPSYNRPDAYVPSVQFANKVIIDLVRLIKNSYAGKDFVIIIQSDHGFKFEETNPLFNSESCKIYFAAYSSQQGNNLWKETMAGVNTFSVLFNHYFQTSFPVLPPRPRNLRYRE